MPWPQGHLCSQRHSERRRPTVGHSGGVRRPAPSKSGWGTSARGEAFAPTGRYQTRQTRLTISFGQVKRETNDPTPDSRPGLRSSARSETGLIKQSVRPRTLAMANLKASPPRSPGEAKSKVVVVLSRRVHEAAGGPGEGRAVEPGAAPKDAGLADCWSFGINV